jgi:type III secretion system low calcium response chaperone LcrH/SycD
MGLRHLTQLSDGHLQLIHQYAYSYYKQGQYEKACDLFRFLTVSKVEDSQYWIGYGASQQMLGRYEEALKAYEMAAILDQSNIHVHLYAADCFFCLSQLKDGIQALKSAEKLAQISQQADYLTFIRQLIVQRQAEVNNGT